MNDRPPAIDCWFNVNMGQYGTPDYLIQARREVFRADEALYRDYTVEETVELFDRTGIERAIITTEAASPSAHVLSFIEKRPDRFALGLHLDPRHGARAARRLKALVADHPAVLARVIPFESGLAPDEPLYYPIYSACCELDLPLTVNTGIPGPPVPAACQDPLHLDRVCLDFPELVLCMAHGADPWWKVAMRLMLKYPGLHLMTSAYLPKYLPAEFVHFMNTRGQDKVIFASDHPAIEAGRCLEEAAALELRPGVLEKYLSANARRVFFDGN